MPPRGLNLELIPSISARKASFRKRKKSIFKKLEQLKRLCGIEACAVVRNPFDGKMEAWPSEEGAKAVVRRFNVSRPAKIGKFSMNQESHLRKTLLSFSQRLERQKKKNNGIVSDLMVNGLRMERDGTLENQEDLRCALSKKIKEADARIDHLKGLFSTIDLNKNVLGSP